MDQHTLSRAILGVDGVACGVAAMVVVAGRRFEIPPALPHVSRSPVALALAATSMMLMGGARKEQPDRATLTRAAAINVAWVAACVRALPLQTTMIGRLIVAGTAVGDAAAAIAQFSLRGKAMIR